MEKFDFYIFTDGASSQNPGPGGFGAIVISDVDLAVKEVGGGNKNTTNNKMEIQALISGLRETPEGTRILALVDSHYVIKGITLWIKKWIRNGWRTSLKKPVENQDLWQELNELVSKRELVFKYVPGHSGILLNERADEIAVSFANNRGIKLFNGPKENYPIDFGRLDFEKDFSVANGENVIKRKNKDKKAFAYISLVNGKFFVDKEWEVCKKRVSGIKALYRKVFNEDEIEVWRKNWSKIK